MYNVHVYIYTTRQMTPGFDQSWFWEHCYGQTVAHFGWCSWKAVAENVNLSNFCDAKQICLLPQSGCTVLVSSLALQHCWRSNAGALVLAELVDLINKAGEWRSHRVHSIISILEYPVCGQGCSCSWFWYPGKAGECPPPAGDCSQGEGHGQAHCSCEG